MHAHAELLRRATSDEKLSEAILADYKTAPISARETAMLDYALLLTEDATRVTPENQEILRSHGFDDTAILQITLMPPGSITSTVLPTRSASAEKMKRKQIKSNLKKI